MVCSPLCFAIVTVTNSCVALCALCCFTLKYIFSCYSNIDKVLPLVYEIWYLGFLDAGFYFSVFSINCTRLVLVFYSSYAIDF